MAFENFDELLGSPSIDIEIDRQRATREAKVPWSELSNLINTIFPIGGIPHSFPGWPGLIARRLNIVPLVGDKTKNDAPSSTNLSIDAGNTYEFAKVRLDYEITNDYHENNDPGSPPDPVLLLTHHWSIGGEFLTVPSDGFQWCDGSDIGTDISLGIMIPTIEHSISWPRVQNPPFDTIRESIGKVNQTTMSFRTGEILPETLLFLGAELQRDILSSGALAWEVNYRFSERRVTASDDGCLAIGVDPPEAGGGGGGGVGGWNHFYRSDPESADDPKTGFFRIDPRPRTGAPSNPYPLTELNLLFQETA